jgi:hypothetical protein
VSEFSPSFLTGDASVVNQQRESSRRVGYLQATVKDSNFYKPFPTDDFRNRVARESLRRAFCRRGDGCNGNGQERLIRNGIDFVRSSGCSMLTLIR